MTVINMQQYKEQKKHKAVELQYAKYFNKDINTERPKVSIVRRITVEQAQEAVQGAISIAQLLGDYNLQHEDTDVSNIKPIECDNNIPY